MPLDFELCHGQCHVDVEPSPCLCPDVNGDEHWLFVLVIEQCIMYNFHSIVYCRIVNKQPHYNLKVSTAPSMTEVHILEPQNTVVTLLFKWSHLFSSSVWYLKKFSYQEIIGIYFPLFSIQISVAENWLKMRKSDWKKK